MEVDRFNLKRAFHQEDHEEHEVKISDLAGNASSRYSLEPAYSGLRVYAL